MMKILEKNNEKLSASLSHFKIIYKSTQNKRGLIDAIDVINKTLFDTMDAGETDIWTTTTTSRKSTNDTTRREISTKNH